MKQLFKSTIMGVGMVALFHLKMGMKPVLVSECRDSPLVVVVGGGGGKGGGE